jgi:hypothetical protein
MKKQILLFNIFLIFIILSPLFSLDLTANDIPDQIDNISPPEWILGTWILDEESENPFIVEFIDNNIIMDNYSMEEDIDSGYVVAFIQEITEEYYEICVKFDNGDWFQERFFTTSDDKMESKFIASDDTDTSFTYYRN